MPHPIRTKSFGRRVHTPRRPRRRRGQVVLSTLRRLGRLSSWALALLVGGFCLVGLARLTGVWQSGGAFESAPERVVFEVDGATSALGRHVMPVKPHPEQPAWLRFAAQAPSDDGRARAVVVIDDLGLDRAALRRLMKLPGPLTLSFLPYANDLHSQTEKARKAGHELLVHLPMAPTGHGSDPGPMALLEGLSAGELARRLDWNLSRFSGFVGVNNHMGSRLTADRITMDHLMRALAERGLLFLDSRTTPKTIARQRAAAAGLPNAARDIFLDNEQSAAAVTARLEELEALARAEGLAIGIGHPHDETIAALAAWLPGLEARGVVLVPLSAAVSVPEMTARAMSGSD